MKVQSGKAMLEDVIYRIKSQYPEFIYSLNLLELQEVEMDIPISTNGKQLFYHEENVLKCYRESGIKGLKVHVMHVLFHLLLKHMDEIKCYKSHAIANLLMDYRVNRLVLNMLGDEMDFFQQERIEDVMLIERQNPKATNYFSLKKNPSLKRKMMEFKRDFTFDDHMLWNKKLVDSQESEEDGQTLEMGEMLIKLTDEEIEQISQQWKMAIQITFSSDQKMDFSEMELETQKIVINSKKKQFGKGAGSGLVLVNAQERREQNYEKIIRECLKMNMRMEETPDSIDRMLYQYGFDLYDNVALIEPMEEEEVPEIRRIGIAIDTSGSCNGEVAGRFLGVLGAVFRDAARYLSKADVYIFECDDCIQKEEHLEGMEIDDQTFQYREMAGWGGTSFVPVFQRMDELQEQEDITFDALLYLTDGMGDYPEKKPSYPTYFLMTDMDEIDYGWIDIPKWIHKIAI